jgi:uncharacterized protein (TIGR03118 family)
LAGALKTEKVRCKLLVVRHVNVEIPHLKEGPMSSKWFGRLLLCLAFVLMVTASARSDGDRDSDHGSDFTQTNLVSDISGLATITDANLVNPWGVSHTPTSPFWVSNLGTKTSTLYAVTDSTTVTKAALTVAIPTTASGPQGPTGQVANTNTSSFLVKNGGDGGTAHFIFASLNGTISAWDKGTTAFIQVTTAGAVYSGLASNGAQTVLYAANDAGTGSVDVFDSTFTPLKLGTGAFVDPDLPTGLVPFNVADISGDVYVLYAPSGHTNQSGAEFGSGAVAVFTEGGVFVKELVVGGRLAAPWGITLAPPSFGRFASDLLIGNFSYLHSEINAFDPVTGKFRGTISIDTGSNTAGGLWTIAFGVGGSNGSPDTLYFTDGINGEKDGLFGALSPNPEKHCEDCDDDGGHDSHGGW